MFDHIILEEEQIKLFCIFVEASRNISRDNRQKFHAVNFIGRNLAEVIHPGLPKDFPGAYMGDIEILAHQGFFNYSYGSHGSINFDITPVGYKYYEYVLSQIGEPVKRVEKTIIDFIDSHYFQTKYSIAYNKWSEAEDKLWVSETEKQFTVIGHLCREALQLFVSNLIDLIQPNIYDKNQAHTVARLKAVINHKQENIGKIELEFCLALVAYWGTTSDLIQRQEHGAQKEEKPLTWEDGRRIVFQTLILMYEIDRSLFS